MNPFEIRPWYPNGVQSFIAAGGFNYVALIDETTVLKFPLIPPLESTTYSSQAHKFRVGLREAALKGLEAEKGILTHLRSHPRIVQLKGVHEHGLLLEFLPHGSVERYIKDHTNMSKEQCLKWGRQAAEGLAYIHDKNVLHCDLSVGNLLLDSELSIKLCDFQGKLLSSNREVALDGGTLESIISSMPRPNRACHTRKTDIFALGTVLYIIMNGQVPFPDLDPAHDEDEIQKRFERHEFPLLDNLGGDIISKCWRGVYNNAADVMVDLQTQKNSISYPL
jgi:serine/threonine protein kinase